jgi:hypothetical protein
VAIATTIVLTPTLLYTRTRNVALAKSSQESVFERARCGDMSILEKPLDLKQKDATGRTLLHIAVVSGI